MENIREFLRSPAGRITGMVLILVGVGALFLSLRGFFGRSEAASIASERTYICAETGKPFNHKLVRGERIPVESPHSGKPTGYPAELCYWTADGHIASKPTAVLLNKYAGIEGPTFCKVCGRLVVPHNPMAREGMTPPPTQAEYEGSRLAKRGGQGTGGRTRGGASASTPQEEQ
jgi:hypothetical protein